MLAGCPEGVGTYDSTSSAQPPQRRILLQYEASERLEDISPAIFHLQGPNALLAPWPKLWVPYEYQGPVLCSQNLQGFHLQLQDFAPKISPLIENTAYFELCVYTGTSDNSNSSCMAISCEVVYRYWRQPYQKWECQKQPSRDLSAASRVDIQWILSDRVTLLILQKH